MHLLSQRLKVAGLDHITLQIPRNRRPRFVDTHITTLKPPDSSQHPSKPDIAVTHPGVEAPKKSWEWGMCACTIEVKEKSDSDPITAEGKCETAKIYHETIAQLAKNGRNLLLGNLSCFVFVIGIYGNCARIFRFDRSGLIISKAFEYTSSPDILAEFFWRLVHPAIDKCSRNTMPSKVGRVVGSDPTISRPTKAEAQLMAERIQNNHPLLAVTPDDIETHSLWLNAEWVQLPKVTKFPPNGCAVRCLTIGAPLWQSTGLFSRATIVWKVVFENHEKELYALKDSWRERCRFPEWYFYARIETHAREKSLNYEGIATLVGSVDLAKRHPSSGHRTRSAELRPTPSTPEVTTESLASEHSSQQSTLEQSFQQPTSETSPQEPSSRQSSRESPPPEPSSSTSDTSIDSCLLDATDSNPRDRNHMRTITWPMGEPLSLFLSTKELITAIRSAIKG